MTFFLSFAAGPSPAFLNLAHRPDSVMCSSGVVVNYNTDLITSPIWVFLTATWAILFKTMAYARPGAIASRFMRRLGAFKAQKRATTRTPAACFGRWQGVNKRGPAPGFLLLEGVRFWPLTDLATEPARSFREGC
jgi:hypothetical protein